MGSLEIRPVHSTGDLRRFIRLPFRLYRDEPNWVAPLIFERKQFLDRRKNPFFEHGRAEYFLALRDGRPVGRITAQVDDNFQRFQENRWGWFGFFECEQDPEAAAALLDRAEQWLRGQGCDRMVGPGRLHDQRRVRRAARGPRAHAADPLAVDAPLLPGAARGRRHGEGDGPADVGAAHLRPRQGQPGDLEARRPGRGAPRRRRAARSARRTSRPRSAASWRSTTRPGRRTGASCR